MRNIKYIVVHCTGTPINTSIRSIKNYWKNKLKWKEPGYHYIIKSNGEIINLQPISKPSNGVKGYNAHAIHISYIGGEGGIDTRTQDQKKAIEYLITQFIILWPDVEVLGHKDFPGVTKTCPNYDVKKEVKKMWINN